MKSKLLVQLLMFSKRAFYGFILQCLLLNFIWASVSTAQQVQSVNEVKISLNLENASIVDVFREIEAQTSFVFTYISEDLNPKFRFTRRTRNMIVSEVLLEISKNANLKFKQVNNNINVSPRQLREVDKVIEVIIQTRSVRGTVISNEDEEPLPGVNVVEKGTSNGTVTSLDGNYTLTVNEGATLVFSSVGFTSEEILVGNQSVIDLTMMQDIQQLQELVVVGYGIQDKNKMIGSVSQVKSEQVNDRTVPQLQQALTGQMPGVTVIQRSGQPGSPGGAIQIRGVGSVSSSNAPLILVDGIPAASFNDVDPNVIENISVLKDASSAAIYGSRAANGVVLITTKTAKTDKIKISYNGYAGIQTPTEYPEFVNSAEYAVLLNEANTNDGLPASYSDDEIQLFRNGNDPDNYPNSDFIGEVLKRNSTQTGHNLTISNSLGSSNYFLSFGYLYQNGIIDENHFNRYNLRLNLVSDLTPSMKLTSRLYGIQTSDKQPSGPASLGNASSMLGIIGQAVRYPPIYPIRLSNGDWGGGFEQSGTPASFLASESFFEENRSDVGLNLQLDWYLIPDLKFTLIGGYTVLNSKSKQFAASQQITPTNILGPANSEMTSYGETYRTFQQLLEYDKVFGDHAVSVLAGHTFEGQFIDVFTAFRQGFPNNDITRLNAGSADGMSNSGTAREWALDSYIGRVRYSFRNKYLLEGVVRRDGSSRFPTSRKYATFPSVAMGWRLSEESFIKNNVSWLDELKLKGSWGQLGAQALAGAAGFYPYQNLIETGYNYPFGNVISTGVARTRIIDPDLQWETTEAFDLGIETSIMEGLLSFSATYFNKKAMDLLITPGSSVSTVLGFTVGPQNSGISRNYGFEFTLEHRKTIKDFRYSISTNLTRLNNEIVDLGVGNIQQPNGLVGNGSDLFNGQPMQLYYGFVADGLFVDQNDIDAYADQTSVNSVPRPGDIRYKDISGPDRVPDGIVDATYDRAVLGSQIPKYNYGINLGAGYKNFNLSMLIQGTGRVSGRLDNASGLAFVNQGGIQRWMADERWSSENPDPDAGYPRLEIIPNGGTPNSMLSSFWVLDASYLKIRNVQLSYNIPNAITEPLNLANAQLRFNAENILNLDRYRDGWDPEINTSLNYYPILANFTLGLKVDF